MSTVARSALWIIIHVAVAGASGKLGSVAAEAFRNAAGFEYAGGFARKADPSASIRLHRSDELLARKPDVLFDALTLPASFDVTMKAVAARRAAGHRNERLGCRAARRARETLEDEEPRRC